MIIAVLDACVLYPPSLRDLLMRIAAVGAYEPRLTKEIHAEWMRNVLADNPQITAAQLERTRRLMNLVTPDCLVSHYEAPMANVRLPDANDRHVLAAAIVSQAEMIVTYNLLHFPETALREYGVLAVHPDTFLCALFDENPELFLRGLRAHRASLQRPPKTAEEYIATLTANRLNRLASHVETCKSSI